MVCDINSWYTTPTLPPPLHPPVPAIAGADEKINRFPALSSPPKAVCALDVCPLGEDSVVVTSLDTQRRVLEGGAELFSRPRRRLAEIEDVAFELSLASADGDDDDDVVTGSQLAADMFNNIADTVSSLCIHPWTRLVQAHLFMVSANQKVCHEQRSCVCGEISSRCDWLAVGGV